MSSTNSAAGIDGRSMQDALANVEDEIQRDGREVRVSHGQHLETRSSPGSQVQKDAFVRAFSTTTLREPFNRNAALYMLQHAENMPAEHKQVVAKLLKESQGKSELEVTYRKGKQSDSMGRWFSRNPSSMQRTPKRVRGTVCKGLWIDLDFANCHPTLYLQLCEKKLPGVPCPHLRRYVESRYTMLEEMVAAGVPSRAEAKERVLKAMNGGRVVDVDTSWWEDMCREFRLLAREAAKHPDHLRFLKNAKSKGGDSEGGNRNIHARTVNAVLCFIENQCLEVLFDGLEQNECVPKARCSLIFDGLMIPDTPYIRDVLASKPFPGTSFLDDVSQHIEDETGYRLKIVAKPFDDTYELPEGYEELVQDGAAVVAREALVSYVERSLLLLGNVTQRLVPLILKLFRAALSELSDVSERQRMVEAGKVWLSRCGAKTLQQGCIDTEAGPDDDEAMQVEAFDKEGICAAIDLDEHPCPSVTGSSVDANELLLSDTFHDHDSARLWDEKDMASLVAAFPSLTFGDGDNHLLRAVSSLVRSCLPFFAFRNGMWGNISAMGVLHCINLEFSVPQTLLPALLAAFPDDKDDLILEMKRRFPSQIHDCSDTGAFQSYTATDTQTGTADECCYTYRHAEILRESFVVQVSAPDFIRTHLPAIMGANVLNYHKTDEGIRFELDDWSPEGYELTFADGIVWSSTKGQVRSSLYEPARHYIGPGKGDRSAAEFVTRVLWDRLRYDREEKKWRLFKPDPGVWEVLDGDACHVVGNAVWDELTPLVSLEGMAGRALWGSYDPNQQKEDDEEKEDDDLAPPRKKCRLSADLNGFLGGIRYKYAEVHRHTKDLVAAMQATAACFFINPPPNLLLCTNGVIDLRTGQLLGAAKPDQLFTSVCPTKYDPSADTGPALYFFRRFFPVEVFPDAEDIVRFLQLWFGYSITGEVKLQLAVIFKGRGSNGKTVIGRVLERVLGSEIRKSLPCASLGKPDGVNNDPLFSARKARVVTVSEIDRGSDIKEKRFKEITGEEGEVFAKTMYGKEISFQPIMKATFFVNDLPSIMEQGEFRVGRRCAIVPMRVSFVNRNTEAGRAEAEALREMGQPEALIVDLDPGYFETHVVGNEKAFLNFMVQGARLFYSTGRMCVPESLNEHVRGSNTEEAKDVVRAFVEEKLYVSCGQRVLTKTLYKAFKDYIGQEVDFLSFSMDDFGVELKKSIATKGGEWCTVVKKQGSVQGVKGKMWVNLCVRDGV